MTQPFPVSNEPIWFLHIPISGNTETTYRQNKKLPSESFDMLKSFKDGNKSILFLLISSKRIFTIKSAILK